MLFVASAYGKKHPCAMAVTDDQVSRPPPYVLSLFSALCGDILLFVALSRSAAVEYDSSAKGRRSSVSSVFLHVIIQGPSLPDTGVVSL